MAIKRVSLLSLVQPVGADVYFAPLNVIAANDKWHIPVIVIKDGSSRSGIHGAISIPNDYVGTAKLIIVWTSGIITATSAVWDFDYRAVGGDDAESLDQTGQDETLSVTDGAPSAVWERMEAEITLTSSNLLAKDTLEFLLARDTVNASDTLVGDVALIDALLEYADV